MTPEYMPSLAAVAEVAHAIAAESPPRAGRAIPRRAWKPILRKAGWPCETVTVALPTRGHAGKLAPQPVAVVPQSWLRELARRLGVPWRDACRGRIDDPHTDDGR